MLHNLARSTRVIRPWVSGEKHDPRDWFHSLPEKKPGNWMATNGYGVLVRFLADASSGEVLCGKELMPAPVPTVATPDL